MRQFIGPDPRSTAAAHTHAPNHDGTSSPGDAPTSAGAARRSTTPWHEGAGIEQLAQDPTFGYPYDFGVQPLQVLQQRLP